VRFKEAAEKKTNSRSSGEGKRHFRCVSIYLFFGGRRLRFSWTPIVNCSRVKGPLRCCFGPRIPGCSLSDSPDSLFKKRGIPCDGRTFWSDFRSCRTSSFLLSGLQMIRSGLSSFVGLNAVVFIRCLHNLVSVREKRLSHCRNAQKVVIDDENFLRIEACHIQKVSLLLDPSSFIIKKNSVTVPEQFSILQLGSGRLPITQFFDDAIDGPSKLQDLHRGSDALNFS